MEKPIWYLLESEVEILDKIYIKAIKQFGEDATYELSKQLLKVYEELQKACIIAEKLK